jgi:hypothetical protein
MVAVGVLAPEAGAQSLEPRAYANAPVGLNFAVAGYAYSSGGVVFDPSVPLEDAEIDIHSLLPAYVRAFGVFGKSAKIQCVIPYARLSGSARLETTAEAVARNVSGLADPAVRLAVNFHGAPALTPKEFRNYRETLIVGASLLVTAPAGQYDPDRLVNIGSNRWSLKPELGASKTSGRWVLEGAAALAFYTANDEFYGGVVREQAPVYSFQAHVIYNFTNRIWAALDATYYGGGRTTTNGIEGGDLARNGRGGATLTLPAGRRNSIKLYASNGIVTRTGSNFLIVGFFLQRYWGAGS